MAQRIRVDLQTGIIGAPLGVADVVLTFDAVPDFPTLGVDEFVAITLVNEVDVSLSEIVHLTAYTSGDLTGTIARAQEGPAPAAAWPAGTRWDSAPTAEEIDQIESDIATKVSKTGDTITGEIVLDDGTANSPLMFWRGIGGVQGGIYADDTLTGSLRVFGAPDLRLESFDASGDVVLEGTALRFSGTPVFNGSTLTQVGDGVAADDAATVGQLDALAAEAVLDSLVDAKGDMIVGTGADTVARKAVGSNYYPLVANSAESDGLAWMLPVLTAMGFGALGMASALYYADQSPGSTLTLTAGTVYYTPVLFGRACTLDRMGLNVSSSGGASSTIRLGLYTPDATTGLPAARLADFGTVSGNGTGHRSVTISQAVTAGLYWKAVVAQGTGSPTVRASAVSQHGALVGLGVTSNFDAGNNVYGFSATGVTGGLPATPTLSSAVLTFYPTALWRAT